MTCVAPNWIVRCGTGGGFRGSAGTDRLTSLTISSASDGSSALRMAITFVGIGPGRPRPARVSVIVGLLRAAEERCNETNSTAHAAHHSRKPFTLRTGVCALVIDCL